MNEWLSKGGKGHEWEDRCRFWEPVHENDDRSSEAGDQRSLESPPTRE